jgi:class 3 adenylate cyclase
MDPPSGTVTFLFTDMVGSSAIWDARGIAMQDATERHDALLRRAFSEHGGYVFAYLGDGFAVAFAAATDAVKAVVQGQEMIAEESWPAEIRVRVRMALHTGEAVERGGTYNGPAVIRTQRIGGIPYGAMVLLSATTAGIVDGGLPTGISLRDLGERLLRGLSRPEHIYQLVGGSLPEGDDAGEQDRPRSAIAAIVFMDITDSTALTEQLGDALFRVQARELDAALRSLVRAHGGTPIEGKLLGDGVLATFTSARDAIETALHCRLAARSMALDLHLGAHAGDVIHEGNNVYGGAVNIAARICDLSAPGQVLVSDALRWLARTSTNVRFIDRGEHSLKGVVDRVRIFEIPPLDAERQEKPAT